MKTKTKTKGLTFTASINAPSRQQIADELRFFAEQVELEADAGGSDEPSLGVKSGWTISPPDKPEDDRYNCLTIEITGKALMEKGRWDDYCRIAGINPYAMNEGLVDPNEPLQLTAYQAEELGLIHLQDLP